MLIKLVNRFWPNLETTSGQLATTMTKKASKWEFLSEETCNKHTESKTFKFDESRFVLKSDLDWVTDVEIHISIKSGVV